MRKYVSYLRVSTTKQGHSGLGIEAQRNAVANYLSQVGGTLLDEYVEIESGSRSNRPILVQSIAQCRSANATLLIAKLDRLARNVAFVSSLMESGIEFIAVDAPYANRLMIHILAAFAEHERELISQRTKLALAAARERGITLGANGSRLGAIRKGEACAAAEIMRKPVGSALEAGARTLTEIAVHLNEHGHRTRTGASWSAGTVHRLIRRLEETASTTPITAVLGAHADQNIARPLSG